MGRTESNGEDEKKEQWVKEGWAAAGLPLGVAPHC